MHNILHRQCSLCVWSDGKNTIISPQNTNHHGHRELIFTDGNEIRPNKCWQLKHFFSGTFIHNSFKRCLFIFRCFEKFCVVFLFTWNLFIYSLRITCMDLARSFNGFEQNRSKVSWCRSTYTKRETISLAIQIIRKSANGSSKTVSKITKRSRWKSHGRHFVKVLSFIGFIW